MRLFELGDGNYYQWAKERLKDKLYGNYTNAKRLDELLNKLSKKKYLKEIFNIPYLPK